jgi:uncharacterized protein YneR
MRSYSILTPISIALTTQGYAMAQVVGHRLFISETQLQFQAVFYVIYGGQSDAGTGFSLIMVV